MISYRRLIAIMRPLWLRGGLRRVSHLWWEWDTSGNCQRPLTREHFARPKKRETDKVFPWEPGKPGPIGLRMIVRCKKCDRCTAARAASWRLRAMSEFGNADRVWFVTLTFRPEVQHRVLEACRRRTLPDDFDALGPDERFRLLANESGREVTKYLKRLRASGAVFRYLAVAEAHKSGRPHWHVLVYERGDAVRWRTLSEAWGLGFVTAKLADKKAAHYLCKYLTKSLARVRASLRFGKNV